MKIAVSSYSFNRLFQKNELNQFDCIAVAQKMGFDGIEFVDILPHDGSSREAYAQKLADECKKQGMTVTSYTFAADLLAGSGGDMAAEVQRVKDELQFAKILGAPRIRHDAAWGIPAHMGHFTSFDDVLPTLIKGCRDITDYAQTLGIHTMVENHGMFAQDSERMEKLVAGVAHPNFFLLGDMGNFLCVDENPADAYGRIAPYIDYAHAKDFHVKTGMAVNPGEGWGLVTRGGNRLRGAIVGHGEVPVLQCLQLLKNTGYDGFVAIEFEGIEDPMMGIQLGHDNLKRYLAQLV